MSSIVQSVINTIHYLIESFLKPYMIDTIICLLFQVEKLKFREVKEIT